MSKVLKTGEPYITQGFKWNHKAVDIVKAPKNLDYITAHTGGKVIFCQVGKRNNKGARGNESYGNCVKIDHGNGWATLYAHLDKVYVNSGDEVRAGQNIGYMGNTGNSYGAHLHFEVWHNGERINPIPYLDDVLPMSQKKSAVEVAKEIMQGKWGNGAERKKRLEDAGYNYRDVQNAVNTLFSKPHKTPAEKSDTEIAREVIAGKWGNGLSRRNALKNAGYNPSVIQKLVNGMLK